MKKDNRYLAFGAAFATFMLFFVALFMLDHSEQKQHQAELHSDTQTHLSMFRARIESALNARLHITSSLAAYVSTHPEIDAAEFRALAGPLYEPLSGVQSIRLARDSVISHIYPEGGLEGDLGTRLLDKPKLREPILRAIEARKTVMAGPIQLRPDVPKLLISRTPIFFKSKGVEKLWGLTCIFIYQDKLFSEIGLKPKTDRFVYALRGQDALGERGEIFWGEPQVFSGAPVVMDVWLPTGSWQIAAVPVGGWNSLAPNTAWLRGGGAIVTILATLLIWFLVRIPARLREMVADATAELSASENRQRELMEQASVGILLTDLKGNCIFANSEACRMTGWTMADLRRMNIHDLIPSGRQVEQMGNLQAMADGETMSGEFCLHRKDGDPLPIEVSARRTRENIQWIARDISERKQIESLRERQRIELEHASRLSMVGEMASGLAHELGQPLSAAQNYVGGCIARAAGNTSDTGELLKALQLADTQIARAGKIIHQMKDFTRKREPSHERLDINLLIGEVITLLSHEAREPCLNIRLELDDGLPMVMADKIEIEQVVINLLKNSLEATQINATEAKEILVRAFLGKDGMVTVAVEDNGAGIPEDCLDKLFKPFVSSKEEGMGLGLSICSGIINACNGRISGCNKAGGGAIFSFALPPAWGA